MQYWDRLNFLFGGNGPVDGQRIPLTSQGAQFFEYGNAIQWRDCQSAWGLKTIYESCSPLAAIINKKANAFIAGEIDIVNYKTQKSVRGQYKEWEQLFNNPNPIQTRSQFLKQLYTYTIVRGWCYAMPIYSVGFNDRPSAIWLLPPWAIDVRPLNTNSSISNLTTPKREVWFNYGGVRTQLNEEELIMFTDIDAVDIDPYTLLPISRITTLQYPITNLMGALESRATLIQKRGAIGIFSNEAKDTVGSIPMKDEDKKQLQQDFSKYGLSRSQWQYIITNASLKWQSTVMSVKDLMLHDEHKSAISDMCDTLNYPAYLVSANLKNGTFNNVDEAKKSLYQEGVMPESKHIFEQLNTGLKAIENNIQFRICYDEIEVLQESELEASKGKQATADACAAAFELGTMTLDDCREAQGMERVEKEPFTFYVWEFEKWKRDSGYTAPPLSLSPNAEFNNLQNQNNGQAATP